MYFTGAENIQSTCNGVASPVRDTCKRKSPWNQSVKKNKWQLLQTYLTLISHRALTDESHSDSEMKLGYELTVDINLELLEIYNSLRY